MKIPPGASPSPPPESCRAPSESPPAATANHGGSHQTAPSRPSPPSSGPSPPAAGATPTAPRAPPPQTPPPSPRTPPPSAASPPAATGPGHRPPGESWPCRLSWLLLLAAQSLLALQDAALDRPQSLELLAQRFFAFISLLIGALALARDAIELAGEALALDDLRVKERRKASKPRCGGIGHRLEQFCCARVVAQRGGQRGEQRRKSQAIYGARLARKGVLRAAARVSTLMVPPLGVNFTALPSRLSMIERSFSGSASTLTLSRSSSRRCPLACTASWCGRATSWTRASSATARACSGPAECSARW